MNVLFFQRVTLAIFLIAASTQAGAKPAKHRHAVSASKEGRAAPARLTSRERRLEARISALEAKIEQLEQRPKEYTTTAVIVPAHERHGKTSAFGQGLTASAGHKEDSPPKADDEKAPLFHLKMNEPSADTRHLAGAEIGPKGVKIISEDGFYSLQFQGLVQIDGRYFAGGDVNVRNDISDRRARPGLVFRAGDFTGMLQEEIASGTSRLLEAYVDYKVSPTFRLRFGKIKTPLDIERWISNSDLKFAEMNVVSYFSPDREYGLMAYGQLGDGLLEYQAGVFNGGVDVANNDADEDGAKDAVVRAVVTPFKKSGPEALKGLAVGAAGSYGRHKGTPTSITARYQTPGRQTLFRYAAGVFEDGEHIRIIPQLSYQYKQAEFVAEYGLTAAEMAAVGVAPVRLVHTAAQAQFSWVWTGETPSLQTGVIPAHNFNLKEGTFGALESSVRIGHIDFDDDAFPLFADSNASASGAILYGLALNWYLNPNIRFLLDYENTRFAGGALGGGDRTTEQVFVLRSQLRF